MAKILAVLDAVPHPYHGGGGITGLSLVKSFAAAGHTVSILALQEEAPVAGRTTAEHVAYLETLGISSRVLGEAPSPGSSKLRKLVAPMMADFFSGTCHQEAVQREVARIRPDGIFAYHWDALASVYGIDLPKMGLVGDPIHLTLKFRQWMAARHRRSLFDGFSYRSLKARLKGAMYQRHAGYWMRKLLGDFDVSGAFAAHHARELGCRYFRTPTPDPGNGLKNEGGKKFRILHIGHLKGIATISGVEMLADAVLPRLREILPRGSFEIHLVGGFFETLPESLRRKLTCEEVVVRGQVTPSDEEFRKCDVLIVPTPIDLGIRVRVITGFSFGCCIVVHEANRHGIPEIEHKKNALVAQSGSEIADQIREVFENRQLREGLQRGARKTYVDVFSEEAAGAEAVTAFQACIGVARSFKAEKTASGVGQPGSVRSER